MENILDRVVKFINDFSLKSYRDEETKQSVNNIIHIVELFKHDDGREDTEAVEMFAYSFNVWRQLKDQLSVECGIEVLFKGRKRKIEVIKSGSSIKLDFKRQWLEKLQDKLKNSRKVGGGTAGGGHVAVAAAAAAALGAAVPAQAEEFLAQAEAVRAEVDVGDVLPSLIEEMSPDDETSPVQFLNLNLAE